MSTDEHLLKSAHTELEGVMKQEVVLMREILANMNQEEASLLLNDKGSWNAVMQQRYQMVERLSHLRSARSQATRKLEALAASNPLAPSIEELCSCELLSLRDQLLSLTERMNRQHARNQTLSSQIERTLALPKEARHAPAPLEKQAKRKSTVATYQIRNFFQ